MTRADLVRELNGRRLHQMAKRLQQGTYDSERVRRLVMAEASIAATRGDTDTARDYRRLTRRIATEMSP